MAANDHGPDVHQTISELIELVDREYDLKVELRPVGGEVAWNYIATTDAGTRLFLKCVAPSSGSTPDVIEVELLARILAADAYAPVASPIPTRGGTISVPWEGRTVWLTTFREGMPLDPNQASSRLRHDIGKALAMVDRALSGVGLAQPPETHWDLQRADEVIAELGGNTAVADAHRLANILEAFTSDSLPALRGLPQQLIHNDANGDNVLVGERRLITIIDFGDAVIGSTAQELGTALAYLTASESMDRLVESMADVVEGYQTVLPMPLGWAELLPGVARARCAFALANTRIHATALAPGWHRDYVLRNERRTERRLELLLSSPVEAQAEALRRTLKDRDQPTAE